MTFKLYRRLLFLDVPNIHAPAPRFCQPLSTGEWCVTQVKKGPLGETSPMLNDISGVPGWAKVNIDVSIFLHAFDELVITLLPNISHCTHSPASPQTPWLLQIYTYVYTRAVMVRVS